MVCVMRVDLLLEVLKAAHMLLNSALMSAP